MIRYAMALSWGLTIISLSVAAYMVYDYLYLTDVGSLRRELRTCNRNNVSNTGFLQMQNAACRRQLGASDTEHAAALANCQGDMEAERANNTRLKKDNTTCGARRSELAKENSETMRLNNKLTTENTRLKKDNTTCGARRSELAKENSDQKAEITSLQSRLQQCKRDRDKFAGDYGPILAENRRLKDDLRECKTLI